VSGLPPTESLIPHISYGVTVGLLLERHLRHEGTFFALVRQACGAFGQRRAETGRHTKPARR
jgi:hypothetical protein